MLSQAQLRAINLLLEGKTQEEIASEVDVCVRTVRYWLNNDEFLKVYREQQQVILNSLSVEAIYTLRDLMRNSKNENVRMNCAKDILSRCGLDAVAKSQVDLATPKNIVLNIED